jgi:DNA invertase Pin-like site-specific DNA recombinase
MQFKGKNLVAEYLRLSREDGDKLESDSISNQRDLINEYLSKHKELRFAGEYVDDGYTGTNFERPSFKRMMEDVKSGKVNCIIVKDLSRLGRNYIETGRYLEKIFPFLGVRFISILDNYDTMGETSDADQIIMPFKNLINDSYCRDMSMKIRSQLDVKRKNGQFIGSFAVYGYKKDPEDVNHLVIDPVPADIVKLIFRRKLEGYNSQRIADELNGMGILPPAEYKRSQGMNYDCGFRAGANSKWSAVTVNRILVNEMYTGTMVQGIRKKINYRVKKSREMPKDEWIRVENTHAAIIPKEIFEEVQRILLIDTRTSPNENAVYALSGLVVCGDCGQNMVRRRIKQKDRYYTYLHCSTYKAGMGCSSHLINAEKLEKIVLESIQNQVELVMQAQAVLEQIEKIPESQNSVRVIDDQIKIQDAEIERYRDLKTKVYVDMLDEIISKGEFKDINKQFSVKMDQARKNKEALLEKRHHLLANKTHLQPWIEQFKTYRNIQELTRQVAVCVIEKIIVYSKDSVHVCFQYGEQMAEMIALAELDDRKEAAVCVQ